MNKKYHYLIIGSGIMGLTIARALKENSLNARILVIDKEGGEAFHASSRNSGVLHAGFYYSSDSLKAKLTIEGNKALKEYCHQNDLPVNACGKLVVAQNDEDLQTLYELKKRGQSNGSNVSLIDEKQAVALEPNVRTHKKALYSPDTASINPKLVCQTIKKELEEKGVHFQFNARYIRNQNNTLISSQGDFQANKIINCAGLYADVIAHDFGFGQNYTMLPFKGLYLKYTKNTTDVKMNIYPVPNLKNPFLGVHFTKTFDGTIKIGPTATPAFWRENYTLRSRFNAKECAQIGINNLKLLFTNSFQYRDLAWEETRKYNKRYFIRLAQKLVREIDPAGFTEFTAPGIRAQLLHKKSLQLVQDFIVEGDGKSVHVLNAVSPAFTCAFPFARHVVERHILDR